MKKTRRPADLLGTTFDCDCGKTHRIDVEQLIYASDAVARLGAVVAPYRGTGSLNLVADRRTFEVVGRQAANALEKAGWTVHEEIVPDPAHGDPICDDRTRAVLEPRLAQPCDLLVAVGSGVINDLCKWIAADSGTPYVVIATAASMNGYASENIAPAIQGVKRVISGTVPKVILAVPSIIESAPDKLTGAGLGDVVAKPVSMTDWRINHLLFEEYYCPVCAGLIADLEPMYMEHPEGIRTRDPATIKALFDALVFSGVSMTMAATSFPASGGEHLISHVLDMTAMRDGHPHDYHGRQVGLGSVFALALYERLLALENPAFEVRVEDTDQSYWKELACVVDEEHAGKRERAVKAVERLREPGMWDACRSIISESTRSASAVKACLAEAGAAHCIDHIGVERAAFVEALRHCHQIRERYTVVDLARAAGLMPEVIDEIVEEYLLG